MALHHFLFANQTNSNEHSQNNINSCAEVLFVSTIFAVQQMPVFGDGLVENNCAACFLVDTNILPEFAVLCVGTLMNVGVNVWVYRKAHGILYGGGCCGSRASE